MKMKTLLLIVRFEMKKTRWWIAGIALLSLVFISYVALL